MQITETTVEERVEALLQQMTLEEKVGQMNQVRVDDEHLADRIRRGEVGSVILAGSAWAGNEQQKRLGATNLNAIQKVALEESRLGIPVIYGRDVIHGYRTIAPIPLGQAATWLPEVVRAAAEVAAREASADGVHWTFAPMMDIARDGRWGRIAEGYGEDPYLCAAMARAAVQGFQGDDLADPEHMLACAKHYAGYGAAEGGRDYNTTEISENTLRNIYLPSFHAAVKAGVGTIMSGFPEIGGVPITANHHLLTEILRDEWGFDGFVVSDWAAVEELIGHGVAANHADAARLAATAGVDMEMVTPSFIQNLAALVRSGHVPEAVVDEAARRILRIKLRCGLFDHPYTDTSRAEQVQLTDANKQVALEAARKSIVLLKNKDNILPLKRSGQTIGVAGGLAVARHDLFGTWTLDGEESQVVTILDGIRSKLDTPPMDLSLLVDDAVTKSRYCDVMVAVVGEAASRSGEDRSTVTLDLPPGQQAMLEAFHAVGVPLVVVVLGGRPLSIPWLAEHADAVLMAWHPGIMGGAAIADVLFGDENPGGKLPVTFPRSVGQAPIYYNHKATGRPWPDNRQYSRYVDSLATPLYPFGYGLSYTSFAYANLHVSATVAPVDGTIIVSADVTNPGAVAGDEVVQLYIRDKVASLTRPVKELKGFNRIHLEPGQTQTVTFTLGHDELGFYGADNTWTIEPGEFQVWVGPNSAEGLEGKFILK